MWESRVLRRAFERLELHEGKLSRAVLRGGGGGDVTSLPDAGVGNHPGLPGPGDPGAMRFSEEPNDRLHWLRTEGPGTSRLQGNLSGHCRLMGAQSLTCLEYFARRLIRSVRPDRVRFVQSIDDGVIRFPAISCAP